MWKFRRFRPARLAESIEPLDIPGCGWYQVHTLRLDSTTPLEQEIFPAQGQRVALLMMDIGAYQNQDIPPGALERAEALLRGFPDKDLILRVVYDTKGRGLEHEPATLDQILRHMEQLGPIISRCREKIFQLQGIFVGCWGEIHQSKFLGRQAQLLAALDQATGRQLFLAVRTPAQWREMVLCNKDLDQRLGLFNDGIFGSPTDLGTYMDREAELCWQEENMGLAPVCGEAVLGEEKVGYRQAALDLARMRLTCLNSAYDSRQLGLWQRETVEKGPWRGLSGLDYIGRRLGCRFVVRRARLCRENLEITVENCGFSRLHLPAICTLGVEPVVGGGLPVDIPVDANPNNWAGGGTFRFLAPLSAALPPARLFLRVRLKRDGALVPFANQGEKEEVFLGELL